jgi:nucleoside-diphosphate-sugar epimerase
LSAGALSGRRVLVTGASGFIGSRLCSRLRELGAEVYGTSRTPATASDADVRWLAADVVDPVGVDRAFAAAEPEIVFHLASRVAGGRDVELVQPMLRENLLSAVNVLVAAQRRGRPRVVLAGSMEEPAAHSRHAVAASPYAIAKWAATGYARMFHALYGLPAVVLRIFMVYGPGQRDRAKLIPYVIESLLRGESPRLSSGTRAVDWIYVDDVVAAFAAAAQAENVDGHTFDVGSGATVTVRELVERLVEMMGSAVEPDFGGLPDRPLETSEVADVRRTEAVLGWEQATTLDQGLRLTVDWFAERGIELGDTSA